MAKLPQYRRQVTRGAVNVGRESVDTSLSGAINQAATGASQLLQAQSAMQQREAQTYVNETRNSITSGFAQKQQELKGTATSGEEYTEAISSYLAEEKERAMSNAATPKAAEMTAEFFNSYSAAQKAKSIPVAAGINATRSAQAVKDTLQVGVNGALQDPNSYSENLKYGSEAIMSSALPGNQKEKAIAEYDNELSYYRFKGLIKDSPSAAKSQLESGDWNSRLEPNQLEALTREADQQINSKLAANKVKLSSEISDYMAYKSNGGVETKQFNEQSLKTIYGDEKGGKIYSQIIDVNKFADDYNKVELADAGSLDGLLQANTVTGPEDFRTESAQQNMMAKAIIKRNTELAKDPAKYALKSANVESAYDDFANGGSGENYAATTVAEQSRLGVPNGYEKILPTKQAALMVESYNQGGEDAALFMSNLKSQFGEYTPSVIRDLSAAGLSPNAVTVAILPQGERAATYLAQADKEGVKTLNKTIDADAPKDIKSGSDKALTSYRNTIYNPATYAQVKGSVELLATKYLSANLYDNVGAALEAAANDVINDRYEFVDNYRVPNDVSSSLVERGVDMKIDSVKDMDLQIPFSSLPSDVAAESYKERLQPKALTMNDDSGVVIVDQFNQPVLTAEGEVISYTWDEISQQEPQEDRMPNFFNLGGM